MRSSGPHMVSAASMVMCRIGKDARPPAVIPWGLVMRISTSAGRSSMAVTCAVMVQG